MDILLVADSAEGKLIPSVNELMAAARASIGSGQGTVTAAVAGFGIEVVAHELAELGLDRVLVADEPELDRFSSGPYVRAIQEFVLECQPDGVLLVDSTMGSDCAPRLAARLRTAFVPGIVGIREDSGDVVMTRPVYGGKALADVRTSGSPPWIATVGLGAFDATEMPGRSAEITHVSIEFDPSDSVVRVGPVEAVSDDGSSRLDEAEIIVSGGRGLGEPGNFTLIESLAQVLDGSVGASRAVVDAGWRPHEEQVGQTGVVVSPKLYIAVGISGAAQHIVGMQSSEHIVVINRDPDAPIFRIASFGIIGDLFEVVPALIEQLKSS